MVSDFEKAQFLFKIIKQEHLETEVFTLLKENLDPHKLDFEVMYDDGGRSFLLKNQCYLQSGNVIIGVIVDNVALAIREGIVRCNWMQAREYCHLYSFLDASMDLMPVNETFHKVYYRLNLLLEKINGDRFSLGWYWTNQEVDEQFALAINLRSGEVKKFEKVRPLRYRPALILG